MDDDTTEEQTQDDHSQAADQSADHSPAAAQVGTSDGDGESS